MRWAALILVAGCGRIDFEVQTDAAYAGPNRVFITSSKHDGNLGGFAGADAICQATADGEGLGGEFVALLWGENGTVPSARLGSSRGWVDTIGRPIADQPAQFDDAHTFHTIAYDESGARVANTEILWTGHQSIACMDWTATTGPVNVTVTLPDYSLWAFIPANGDCADPNHLICVERGRQVPVIPPKTTGRVVFLSRMDFASGGGLGAADMLCNDEAVAAGLGGTFRAWLGSSAGGPETRFTPGGGPYIRSDGLLLAPGDELLSTQMDTALATYLDNYADGSFAIGSFPGWSGTGGYHCTDWTDTSSAFGSLGRAQANLMTTWRFYSLSQCAVPNRVVCLQL